MQYTQHTHKLSAQVCSCVGSGRGSLALFHKVCVCVRNGEAAEDAQTHAKHTLHGESHAFTHFSYAFMRVRCAIGFETICIIAPLSFQ